MFARQVLIVKPEEQLRNLVTEATTVITWLKLRLILLKSAPPVTIVLAVQLHLHQTVFSQYLVPELEIFVPKVNFAVNSLQHPLNVVQVHSSLIWVLSLRQNVFHALMENIVILLQCPILQQTAL